MKTLTVAELVGNPPAAVSMIKQGEVVELVEDGHKLARIIPAASGRKEPRPLGLAKGQFIVLKDFNAPLPEEILRDFEGK